MNFDVEHFYYVNYKRSTEELQGDYRGLQGDYRGPTGGLQGTTGGLQGTTGDLQLDYRGTTGVQGWMRANKLEFPHPLT